MARSPTFNLTTRAGYINLADGTTAYTWGFSEGSKPFQHPGPVLCVNEGDTVTVILHNTFTASSPKSAPAVSIVFPGQENVLADGVPSQPVLDGAGNLTSLAKPPSPTAGPSPTASWPREPGTFLYESGGGQIDELLGTRQPYSSPQIQVRMGLFGALIVRPAGHPDWVYDRADSAFNPATEFMLLLSEIDPYLNAKVLQGTGAFNMNNYQPALLADQRPPVPRQHRRQLRELAARPSRTGRWRRSTRIRRRATNPLPAVDRYLSVGTVDYPFHPHGNNGKVIGRDGTPLASRRRRRHGLRQVRRQRRSRPDLGRAVRLAGRRGLLAHQRRSRRRTRTCRT